jgi:hypothetical protein
MNKALWFFIIIAVSFAVASCVSPLGQTHDVEGSGAGDLDNFWTVTRRQYYTMGDDFVRDSDLWAFASSQGIVQSIPINKVEISLINNPNDAVTNEPIPIVNGRYRLISSIVGTGRKLIIVTYSGKTAEYSIEVRNPDGTTDPSGPGSDAGSGIGIIWR